MSVMSMQPPTPPANEPAKKPLILSARHDWHLFSPGEIWKYRELWGVFLVRDVTIRYKQTVLGVLWAVIRPIISMLVFTLVIGVIFGMNKQTAPLPYPIFVFSGTIIWALFASSLGQSSNSLVSSAGILKKVYFPRLLAPLSSIGTPLVDFVIAFSIYLCLLVYYHDGVHVRITWEILLVFPLVLSALLVALSVGILLTGISVRYRDIMHAVPFVVQTWFFLTPVVFPVKIIPEHYHWMLKLNPMGGVVDAFRAALLGQPIDYYAWGMSVLFMLPVLIIALLTFNRLERRFVDIV